ncbi:p21-activated protein kinase-interacting protein 1-like [Venturia canescens]|uniref:p21-activated protein kinase-interacting protein 1-like n=1 Tax=Venturia canescens TaxID=32260 RepID=UPI001C9CCD80|nr:p21-activated protein kinase-interacting protein 1-like [Venturia canescens]
MYYSNNKMTTDFEIIVGTYEQFLLGYKVINVDDAYTLERSFATHSHLASIRAVASDRHYLASGGADDTVCLYDMRYRIESGRLMHHTGTINCINFTPEASHVMTASNDGSIGIVRCGNWELEKHWKAPHKGNAVNALAIHPSGKLAMSAGGDGVLRTWNLVKGRQAYATNLVPRLKFDAKNVTIIRWSPSGDKYLLASNCKLDVYSVETAGLCAEMSFVSKVACVEFINENLLAIGHEDGQVRVYDMTAGSSTIELKAHDARVKCLAFRNKFLVSASSSGEIKLWRCGKKKLSILSLASCDARITCMSLANICQNSSVTKEEAKVSEESENTGAKVFRMRQEVIIEDEGEENIANAPRKKKKKKSMKRPVEEIQERESSDRASPQKLKKKMNLEIYKTESTKKKKRSLSVVKSDDESFLKMTKRKKIISQNDPNEVTDSTDTGVAARNNKKKKRPIISIEKSTKTDIKKRKKQNEISSSSSDLPVKAKKKKLSR